MPECRQDAVWPAQQVAADLEVRAPMKIGAGVADFSSAGVGLGAAVGTRISRCSGNAVGDFVTLSLHVARLDEDAAILGNEVRMTLARGINRFSQSRFALR